MSLVEGDEYEYESEEVVVSYEKRGNSENYIKEAKYDMAVGHLLLNLKYEFLAAKIIKTTRNVILKLSFNYPYKSVFEKCLT